MTHYADNNNTAATQDGSMVDVPKADNNETDASTLRQHLTYKNVTRVSCGRLPSYAHKRIYFLNFN